ncbi:MAG: hypothetical protein AAF283_10120 [Cyanobacteria bacterium P01_A01_bin.70]
MGTVVSDRSKLSKAHKAQQKLPDFLSSKSGRKSKRSSVEKPHCFPFPCNSISLLTTDPVLSEQFFAQTIALSRQTKYFSRHRVLLVEQARDRPQKTFLKPI